MEEIIEFIKEIPKTVIGRHFEVFERAIEFNQVTEKRMNELEALWKQSKT